MCLLAYGKRVSVFTFFSFGEKKKEEKSKVKEEKDSREIWEVGQGGKLFRWGREDDN